MKYKHLPVACQIIKEIDLAALEIIARKTIEESVPIISMIADEPLDMHDQLASEIGKMWDVIDPDQIAYIVKANSQQEWDDPDITGFFYGLSVEDVILDYVYNFIQEDLEDILFECLGPGEDCGYDLVIRTYDDEVVEERIQEVRDYMSGDVEASSGYKDFSYEGPDEDEEIEEVEVTRMLSDSAWQEYGLVKGYIVEVTGKKAAVYLEDNGKEKLVIPKILYLLKSAKKAKPGKWYEHMTDWKFRLVKEDQVAEKV